MKDQYTLSSYLYDAGPNRVWQLTGEIDRMWINGHEFIDRATLDNVTMYASPKITISGHEYTKHYFMGSERIASNFGSGFANAVTPVSGTQTLISNPQGSLQIISNQLVDKLFRSWDCLGMIPEYVELQTDISVFNDLDAIDNEYTVYFFHPDHLGSTSWVLTGSTPIQHLQYLPFGEDYISEQNVNSTFNTNFTFSGKERDVATGYSYFGFRYYDPSTSIWLSVDPMADLAPGWTPYRYCYNNPVNFIDPTGLLEEPGDPPINGYMGPLVTVTEKRTFKQKTKDFFDTPLAKKIVNNLPVVGGLKQAINGFKEGDYLNAGLGLLTVGLDIALFATMGPAGNALKIAGKALLTGLAGEIMGDQLTAAGVPMPIQIAASILLGGKVNKPKKLGVGALDDVGDAAKGVLKAEAKYLKGGKHGIKWTEGRALAKSTGTPQGQWGSVTDLEFAGNKAGTLKAGEGAYFELPAGHTSIVHMPDGSVKNATHIWVRNNGTGTFHGYPLIK